MANSTQDKDWPTCVGCAILSRSLNRMGTTVPVACETCFQRCCWNSTIDNQTPAAYEPTTLLASSSGSSRTGLDRTTVVVAFAAVLFAMRGAIFFFISRYLDNLDMKAMDTINLPNGQVHLQSAVGLYGS